jgi:rhamnose transport system permease protein
MVNELKRHVRPEQIRELSLLFLIVLVLLFFSTQVENYLSARFFVRVTTSIAILAVVAVGETLVVLTRNVDLSVGSIVGLTAYFVGTQLARNQDMSPFAAVGLAVFVGALLGLVNGVLVSYGRVPAIITTLGTLAIYRAFLVEYSGAKTVVIDSMPKWVQDLPSQSLWTFGDFDIRLMVVLAVIIVVLFQLALAYLQFGRRLYAIGSNPDGARFAGLPSQRIVMTAFVLCGALSGLAGFMFLAQFGNITVAAAQGMELQVIAAVVVGGVNIFGGSGSMLGAFLGVVLINLLQQSLIRMPQISQFWIDALLGILILTAVAIDALILNRLRNLWARAAVQIRTDTPPRIEKEGSHGS